MDPQFISCGAIGPHRIFRNDLFRIFRVNEWIIKLSLSEYLIMMHLVSGELIPEHTLVQAIYGDVETASHAEPLCKHLDRLRKKLRPCGLIVRRITQHGYLLACLQEETITR
jgi:hypothetical protein